MYYDAVDMTRVTTDSNLLETLVELLLEACVGDKSHPYLKKVFAVNVLSEIQAAEETQTIRNQVQVKLMAEQEFRGSTIWVISDPKAHGSIRLEGAVNSPSEKMKAGQVAKSVKGVKDV